MYWSVWKMPKPEVQKLLQKLLDIESIPTVQIMFCPIPKDRRNVSSSAIENAKMTPADIDLVSTHATSTPQGDEQECKAVRNVFGESGNTLVNNTKVSATPWEQPVPSNWLVILFLRYRMEAMPPSM